MLSELLKNLVYFWHAVQGQKASFIGAPNLPREGDSVNAGVWKDVEN